MIKDPIILKILCKSKNFKLLIMNGIIIKWHLLKLYIVYLIDLFYLWLFMEFLYN